MPRTPDSARPCQSHMLHTRHCARPFPPCTADSSVSPPSTRARARTLRQEAGLHSESRRPTRALGPTPSPRCRRPTDTHRPPQLKLRLHLAPSSDR
eukprot:3471069-Rhodomonas_salina.2